MAQVDDPMLLMLHVSAAADHRFPLPSGVPEGTSCCKLGGHGYDGVGAFVISGTVWTTGEVRFAKQYVEQHSWLYRGRLMPWGIVGCWNGGPFWIWKI
jgi:hypothetical protein